MAGALSVLLYGSGALVVLVTHLWRHAAYTENRHNVRPFVKQASESLS